MDGTIMSVTYLVIANVPIYKVGPRLLELDPHGERVPGSGIHAT